MSISRETDKHNESQEVDQTSLPGLGVQPQPEMLGSTAIAAQSSIDPPSHIEGANGEVSPLYEATRMIIEGSTPRDVTSTPVVVRRRNARNEKTEEVGEPALQHEVKASRDTTQDEQTPDALSGATVQTKEAKRQYVGYGGVILFERLQHETDLVRGEMVHGANLDAVNKKSETAPARFKPLPTLILDKDGYGVFKDSVTFMGRRQVAVLNLILKSYLYPSPISLHDAHRRFGFAEGFSDDLLRERLESLHQDLFKVALTEMIAYDPVTRKMRANPMLISDRRPSSLISPREE